MSSDIEAALEALAYRPKLHTRAEVLAKPSPVPAAAGLYAWHFRIPVPEVPLNGCHTSADGTLLYVGISPSRLASPQTLRKRIGTHFRGNAEGSTLRLTLGVLLGLELRRVGSGARRTFTHAGEQWLDKWMDLNALVAWHEHPEPWRIEHDVLKRLSCPLNIDGNREHPYAASLSIRRRHAKALASALPIADEAGQRRRLL